jgi:hypothetical protein
MTTTDVSRLILAHPDLGTAGGAGLHAAITAIYKKVGDNLATRILVNLSVANGATATFEHDFKTAFSDLRYDLYIAANSDPYDLTRITATSSPALSDFAVVATPSFLTTKINVTNNSGSSRNLVLVVFMDPLKFSEGDIQDVDVTSTAPQDGQALVYNSGTTKWSPGASGDASFKLQAVSTPNLTLKGGYEIDPLSGAEYATYDGSGSASTDFGTDQTLNLTTILGGSPANATYYNLCIDRTTLAAATTLSDNGRALIKVEQANYVLLTGTLAAVDKIRYLPIGFIKSATTGNAWSGTGSAFGTFATRAVDPMAVAQYNKFVHPSIVAPNIYSTLALAFAAASAGDRILVLGSYTITAAETLSLSNVEVKFLPNVVVTINGAVKGLIVSGNDNKIIDPKYASAFSGTVPAGIEISGLRNTVDRAKVESTGSGVTITAAYNLASGADKNDIRGLFQQTSGTITDGITDNSGASNNQFAVR